MTSVLRRRGNAADAEKPVPKRTPTTTVTSTTSTRPYLLILIILLLLLIPILVYLFNTLTTPNPQPPRKRKLLNFTVTADDEPTLSTHALPHEDHIPVNFLESGIVCMPSVQRPGVDYLPNAIKSFRIATRDSSDVRRMIVYSMDGGVGAAELAERVFDGGVGLPSWLDIQARVGGLVPPRERTLGDSWERVLWRSKEALDYAEVLHRCAAATTADWVIVIQDDVLFRDSFARAIKWAEEHVVDGHATTNGRRVARVCAGSLFDLGGGVDGEELRSSNMVARVWRRAEVAGWVEWFRQRFDEAPVDWLADRRCRSRRGWVRVMWPNCVRHRGKVSSFVGNRRDGLLT